MTPYLLVVTVTFKVLTNIHLGWETTILFHAKKAKETNEKMII